MRGYKVLNKGLINRYGFQYELNKKYTLDGDLKWKENGFHFCKYPEDTFRYIDAFNEEVDLTEVEGSGEIQLYEDDYYGYYDMYASSEIEIKRIVPREEYISIILGSHNPDRVKRLITTMKLNDDEIEAIKKQYKELDFYIDYYQINKKELKKSL